jgi:3-methyladenine DNA glycosylase AlkD
MGSTRLVSGGRRRQASDLFDRKGISETRRLRGSVSHIDATGEVLQRLGSLSDPLWLKEMARFGIDTKNAYGVSVAKIRALSKEIGRNHSMAQELWSSGNHEARILAGMIDSPLEVSEGQMEAWVSDFDSWDVCDLSCGNLFGKTRLAYGKAVEWSGRKEVFVKRAGFVMMATLAAQDKQAPDEMFRGFLSMVEKGSTDERNLVKKAVNWALRQIGKRNPRLNKVSVQTARIIQKKNSKAARWIAADAIRELTSKEVQLRLGKAERIKKKK